MTDPELRALAAAYGVETSYRDAAGHVRAPGPDALLAVLRALGAPVERAADAGVALRARRAEAAARVIEPVTVVRPRRRARVTLRRSVGPRTPVRLRMEDGTTSEWLSDVATALELPALPAGYHELEVGTAGRSARSTVIAAPSRRPPPSRRDWGVFAPLYGLRSARSWGVGDLTDLAALTEIVARNGGSLVATLPMLAAFLYGEPFEPGPYMPASRLFWNELFVDVERSPELVTSEEARTAIAAPATRRAIGSLRAEPLVDHRRAAALKRCVLERLGDACVRGPGRARLDELLAARPELLSYARFRAAVERDGPWRSWGTEPGGGLEDPAVRFHCYAQLLAHEQIAGAAEAASGLYLDLPVGVHPDGFDVWRHPDLFAPGMSVGAPPDPFFSRGQSWGFPPIVPERSRASGHAYVREMVRHVIGPARVLRIDHVMGLHRLFWVPEGFPATEGVYVTYPSEELYAILLVEAARRGTTLVGEDLGTVPSVVRSAMRRHGVLRSYVLQFEFAPSGEPSEPAPDSVASPNTHDMEPFASFWSARDVDRRVELGLLDDEEAGAERARRAALRRAVSAVFGAKRVMPATTALRACLRHLAASDARSVVVALEDLWGETEPQNVPGTTDAYPNWRRKLRLRVEDVERTASVRRAFRELRRARGGS